MSKLPEKSLLQKLSEVMKPYLANYLIWYYSDPDQRCSWDELCSYDQNFKQKGENAGQNKTQEFCEQNWLIRDDVYAAHEAVQFHEALSGDESESVKW